MRLDIDEDGYEGPNLTPLIDVVFLLLIFFLAATTFASDEVQLDLELPQAQNGQEDRQRQELVIELLADGTTRVDGREVTKQGLEQKLRAVAARDPESPVRIRGDAAVEHRHLVAALDACRGASLRKVGIVAMPGASAIERSPEQPGVDAPTDGR
ncbi:MAG: biopolymer transporter ExbD [Planctomycetota bacterium]